MFLTADVLGHPFGKAPSPVPFDANCEEAKVVLSDPVNPLGKDLLAGMLLPSFSFSFLCV